MMCCPEPVARAEVESSYSMEGNSGLPLRTTEMMRVGSVFRIWGYTNDAHYSRVGTGREYGWGDVPICG